MSGRSSTGSSGSCSEPAASPRAPGGLQSPASPALGGTPRGAGCIGRRPRRAAAAWGQAPAGARLPPRTPLSPSLSADALDESLAQAASSLEISCEVSMNRSTGRASSSAHCSRPSSSWSPASVGERCRRLSNRRSLSDMSQSARMTPEDLKNRGLGIPWQKTAGICTMDLQSKDVAERARQFCLLPTPELVRKGQPSPRTPEASSPRAMQQLFTDRVHMASLAHSPDRTDARASGSAAGPSDSASPGESHASVSPIQPAEDESSPPSEDRSHHFSPTPRRLVRPVSLCSMPKTSASARTTRAGPLHTARRAEERLQIPTKVQPLILKSRRLTSIRQRTPHAGSSLAASSCSTSIPRVATAVKEVPASWRKTPAGSCAALHSKENACPPNSRHS